MHLPEVMRIFLDTAETEIIKKYYGTGLIDGVTTNPTLIKRSRKGGLPKRNIKLGKMKPGGKSKEGETQVKGKTYTYEKDD